MNAFLAFISFISPLSTAPVYTYVSDGILKRSGTFQYKAGEMGYSVLYCIAQPPRITITCVVRTPDDALILISVPATEQKT